MWQRWVTTNMNDTKRSQTKSSFIPAPNFSKILKIHREKKLFIYFHGAPDKWMKTDKVMKSSSRHGQSEFVS